MRLIGILCVLGAGLVLTAGDGFAAKADAKAAAAKNKSGKNRSGKKKSHTVRGIVESVGPGAITVKVHHRKKKGGNAGNSDRTFKIGPGTQVVQNGKAVGLGGLGRGKRVVLHTKGQGQQVASIEIVAGRKKKA